MVNQPTAGVTTSWNINAGSAVVNGGISIGGTNTTSSRVAQIAVTTGSLTVMGSVTYASNANSVTEVISVTTGTITFNNALALSSGTLSVTGAGTINVNGGITYGGVNNPIFSTASGSNVNVEGDLSAGTTALTFNAGSNVIFTNVTTITPSSAITFGNVLIRPGVVVQLAGPIIVNGNFTMQLNSTFNPNSFDVILNGNLTMYGTFIPSTSTVTFHGSGSQTISGLPVPIFNNITIDNSSMNGITLAVDVNVNGTLTLTNGPFSIGAYTLTLNGAINRVNGGLVGGGSSNIVIGGVGSGTILPAVQVNSLIIDRVGGISLAGNVIVNGTLTLTSGTLSIGSNTLTINGAITGPDGSIVGGNLSNIMVGGTGLSTALPEVTLNNLTINRSAGVSLSGDLTINGILAFISGNITTGASKVWIGPSGSVTRVSGHVAGNLQKHIATGVNVSRRFEIGDADNYTPVEIIFTDVSSPGNLISSTTAGDHPDISNSGINPSRSVNRYWTISNDSVIFDQYSAKFNFVAGEIDPGAYTSNFVVERYTSPGWFETNLGTRTATSILTTGITSFGDFAIGEGKSHIITASAGTGGTITPSGNVGISYASNQKFLITPNFGYHVSDLLVDGIHQDSTTSFTFIKVMADHTIDVSFALNVYTITATAGVGGTINPSGEIHITHGADTTFTVATNIGYVFTDLLVDNISVGGQTSYKFSNVTYNHTINARFNRIPTAPLLLSPADGDTIVLYTIPHPVVFSWQTSSDADTADTLNYSINIKGPGLDVTVFGVVDTVVSLDIMPQLQISSTYEWSVNVTDGYSTVISADTFRFRTSTTISGVYDYTNDLPHEYALRQNYPNPFNPTTMIEYQLPMDSKVSLSVYDVLGRVVETLFDGVQQAGYQSLQWNAGGIASGIYFYRLKAIDAADPGHTYTNIKRMMLLK